MTKKPSLTQRRRKESSRLLSAAVQNPNHTSKQYVILANTVAWNTSFTDGSGKPRRAEEAGTCCQDVADVIGCCQPVIDDDAQCSDFVHTLDALLRRQKLDCFASVTA